MFPRNLPDRAAKYAPIGDGLQIADRGKWIGKYRAIAHSPGNLFVERGRMLLEWRKQKCRLSKQNDDPFDQAARPEIIDDGEQQFGDRDVDRDPINIPAGGDHEHGRSGGDRRGDVEIPDGEFRVGATNGNITIAPVALFRNIKPDARPRRHTEYLGEFVSLAPVTSRLMPKPN